MNYSFTSHKISDRSNVDLALYECGEEQYHPGYSIGPAARDYYLIHYIDSGQGTLVTKDRTYAVRPGDGFLIYPGEIVTYGADEADPWHCYWVGFHGLNTPQYLEQSGLSETDRLFHIDAASEQNSSKAPANGETLGNRDNEENRDNWEASDTPDARVTLKTPVPPNTPSSRVLSDHLMAIIDATRDPAVPYIKGLGLLYLFFALLAEQHNKEHNLQAGSNPDNAQVLQAVQYMQHHYMNPIRITELAHRLGFNRSYFYSLFKKHMKVSPKQYLLNLRIARACELMKHTDLNIAEIARSTGFDDPLYFSKVFKKERLHSPQVYKQQALWKQEYGEE